MSNNLVEKEFGYVENVEDETEYKNIDYRDTTVPLWNTLYKNKKERNPYLAQNGILGEMLQKQDDINLALCASIIQLGKNMQNTNADILEKLENDLVFG